MTDVFEDYDEGSHNFEDLKWHILKMSHVQDFKEACKEWSLLRIQQNQGNCPCGKKIRDFCYIQNSVTNEVTYVGNVCVKRFMGVSTGNLFQGLRRILANREANLNEDLSAYALEQDLITKYEYEFLHSTQLKRNLSAGCLTQKREINERILKALVAGHEDETAPKEAKPKKANSTQPLEPHQAIEDLRIELSPDQKIAFDSIYGWLKQPGDLLTFGGFAGTGKTTLLSGIAKAFEASHRIAFCALSGRAAAVLRKKLKTLGIATTTNPEEGHYCGTIHGLIYKPVLDVQGRIIAWNANYNLDYDFIIIDEASMVPEKIYTDLAFTGIPLLAVGDHGQLPPVEGYRNFGLMKNPQLTLTEIHRQARQSPIIRLSEAIRNTGKLDTSLVDKESIYHLPRSALLKIIQKVALKPIEEQLNHAFLCYTNATRARINNLYRQTLFGSDVPQIPQKGEMALCLKNNQELRIFNGSRGYVTTPFEKSKHHFKGEISIPETGQVLQSNQFLAYQWGHKKTFQSYDDIAPFGYRPQSWKEAGLLFDYGYGLTVHKAQGSQFQKVCLCVERPQPVDDETYRKWLYTAVTRTESVLVLLT